MLSKLTKITFIFCFVVIMSFFFSSSNSFSHNLLNSSFQNFRILSVLVILCLMLCAVVKSLIFCHRLHDYSVLCLYSAYFHTRNITFQLYTQTNGTSASVPSVSQLHDVDHFSVKIVDNLH